ncbi:glycosyltransferase family 10 [Kamptonema cortianum]|nr:glycosyltransferase family 10 [Oscillatoria laete-virens]MDK3159964.1 glycosyltransferase family 10 [Kamptonema cortianum]MDL5047195.1 glycosyltransferase family 10 [Oscillatoria amoena NRMC-F 0135]MDL5055473.1 glycosyltransferase family 10 [Oscillatoria laete-virens NRMC-F 0139]
MANSWHSVEAHADTYERLSHPKVNVSVVPNHESGLGNRIFSRDLVINSHWMEANLRWREVFHQNQIEIMTYDLIRPEDADVVIVMDIPEKRSFVRKLKKQAPQAKFILLLLESAFKRPHWFRKENHTEFDAVITYNPKLVDNQRYFRFYFANSTGGMTIRDLPFVERKPCALVNTNYYEGFTGEQRPWHLLKFYRDIQRNGWEFGLSDILRVESRISYAKRRELARCAGLRPGNLLEIYGNGWDGRNYGWFHRFFPDHPYSGAKGPFAGNKLELMAGYRFALTYENYVSDEGYISEKIFDALLAGVVPIYLGDDRILDYVDQACFVDARQFAKPSDIWDFVANCPEKKWSEMRNAGRDYLESERFQRFTPDYFAQSFLNAVNAVMRNHP